jgi:hypothetical protein
MVVILTSLTTSFILSPELEKGKIVYNMASVPYYPPRTTSDCKFLEETKSADETYNVLIKTLRQNLYALAEKIKPKVYEYGFYWNS